MRGFTLIELLFVLAMITLLAAISIPNLVAARRSANEASAEQSLRSLAAVEMDFRTSDRDGNRLADYWTGDVSGLYRIRNAAGAPIALVDLGLGQQDGQPLPEGAASGAVGPWLSPLCAKAGYWVVGMTKDAESGESYAVVTDPEMGSVHHAHRFAFIAYPEEYSHSGQKVFIVNEKGVVLRRDPGGTVTVEGTFPPALAPEWRVYPALPLANGWGKPD